MDRRIPSAEAGDCQKLDGVTVNNFVGITLLSQEALTVQWICFHYPQLVEVPSQGFIKVKKKITLDTFQRNPDISNLFYPHDQAKTIKLESHVRKAILAVADENLARSEDLKPLWGSAKNLRDKLSHQILGISALDLFHAWGVTNQNQWEKRMVTCLNLLSEQRFVSLQQPSLFASLHARIEQNFR